MTEHTCQEGHGPCHGCIHEECIDRCEANADGLIADQSEAIEEICEALGLDKSELQEYLWEKVYHKLMEGEE